MMSVPSLSVYNQDRLDDETFIQNFVARRRTADVLIQQIRKNTESNLTEHHLIVGPRGMGKTSLLRFLQINISRDNELNRKLIALRFREEQYNVLAIENFWQNCIEALADWCEDNNKVEIARRLDQFLQLSDRHDPELCLETFSSALRQLQRRPLLLIDNLNLITDTLPELDNLNLRRVLQSRGGPIIIGASTQFLNATNNKESAFFEFFDPIVLDPLNEDEMLECMSALSIIRGSKGKRVQKIIAREPKRILTLHRLTGGNPRVLVLIYRLLENTDTDSVLSDLEGLLDQVTPYYKARIEEYATPLQRALINCIALNWDPITSAEIAKKTGVSVSTIPAQLKRFREDGLIQKVNTSTKTGHEFVERFLNIWYLMRHGTRRNKQRVQWLVAFFASFYLPDELEVLARNSISKMKDDYLHSIYHSAINDAIAKMRRTNRMLTKQDLDFLGSIGEMIVPQVNEEHLFSNQDDEEARNARDLVESVNPMLVDEDYLNAIKIYEGVIEKYSNSNNIHTLNQVARAHINTGLSYTKLGEHPVADEYTCVGISISEQIDDPLLDRCFTIGYYNKINFTLSEDNLDELLELLSRVHFRMEANVDPNLDIYLSQMPFKIAIVAIQAGKPKIALELFEKIISKYSSNDNDHIKSIVLLSISESISLNIEDMNMVAAIGLVELSDSMDMSNLDANTVVSFHIRVAAVLQARGKTQEAFVRVDSLYSESKLISNLTDESLLGLMGQRADLLKELNENSKAISQYREIVNCISSQRTKYPYAIYTSADADLSELLHGEGMTDEAIKHDLDVLNELESGLKNNSKEMETLNLEFQINSCCEAYSRLLDSYISIGDQQRVDDSIHKAQDLFKMHSFEFTGFLISEIYLKALKASVHNRDYPRSKKLIEDIFNFLSTNSFSNGGSQSELANTFRSLSKFIAEVAVVSGDLEEELERYYLFFDEYSNQLSLGGENVNGFSLNLQRRVIRRLNLAKRAAKEVDRKISSISNDKPIVAVDLIFKQVDLLIGLDDEKVVKIYESALSVLNEQETNLASERRASILNNQGFVLMQLGYFEEAESKFEKILQILGGTDGVDVSVGLLAKTNMAECKKFARQYESAGNIYQKLVLEFESTDSLEDVFLTVLNNYAELALDKLGQYSTAIDLYKRAVKITDGNSQNLLNGLSWAYLFNSDIDRSTNARLVYLASETREDFYFNSAVAVSQDRFDLAVDFLQNALKQTKIAGRPVASIELYRLLKMFNELGRMTDLVKWFEYSDNAKVNEPIYAAALGVVKGETFINDFNPEIRIAALEIYKWLLNK